MQTDRIFDIADVPFAQVPEDEKKRYAGDIKQTGSYRGYKLRQYWVRSSHTAALRVTLTNVVVQHIDNGVRDQLEHYNRTCQSPFEFVKC